MPKRWSTVLFALPVLLSVLLSACSSSPEDELTGGGNPGDGDGVDEVVETDGEPDWTGAPLNPFDLQIGDCFNEYSWIDVDLDQRINLTTVVGCDTVHDREVYFAAEFPAGAGAPYPGVGPMAEFSTELCYEAFEAFIGTEYEVSEYELSFLHPTKETFEHPVGRHRRILCFTHRLDGSPTSESAAGIGV